MASRRKVPSSSNGQEQDSGSNMCGAGALIGEIYGGNKVMMRNDRGGVMAPLFLGEMGPRDASMLTFMTE